MAIFLLPLSPRIKYFVSHDFWINNYKCWFTRQKHVRHDIWPTIRICPVRCVRHNPSGFRLESLRRSLSLLNVRLRDDFSARLRLTVVVIFFYKRHFVTFWVFWRTFIFRLVGSTPSQQGFHRIVGSTGPSSDPFYVRERLLPHLFVVSSTFHFEVR